MDLDLGHRVRRKRDVSGKRNGKEDMLSKNGDLLQMVGRGIDNSAFRVVSKSFNSVYLNKKEVHIKAKEEGPAMEGGVEAFLQHIEQFKHPAREISIDFNGNKEAMQFVMQNLGAEACEHIVFLNLSVARSMYHLGAYVKNVDGTKREMELFSFLGKCKNLRSLYIQGSYFRKGVLGGIFTTLATLPHVETVNLGRSGTNTKGGGVGLESIVCMMIGDCLGRMKALRHFVDFEREGVSLDILEGLQKCTMLESLKYKIRGGLETTQIEELGDVLRSCPALTRVNLGHSSLYSKALGFELCNLVRSYPQVTNWGVEGNVGEVQSEFCRVVAEHATIEDLKIGSNDLGKVKQSINGRTELVAIPHIPDMQQVSSYTCHLAELLSAIGERNRRSPTSKLRSLDIGSNCIGDTALRLIEHNGECRHAMEGLSKLTVSFNGLAVECRRGGEGERQAYVQRCLNFIKGATSLEVLRIDECFLQEDTADMFADLFVNGLRGLHSLVLRTPGLPMRLIAVFISLLQGRTHLREVDIGNRMHLAHMEPVTRDSVDALVQAFVGDEHMESLSIGPFMKEDAWIDAEIEKQLGVFRRMSNLHRRKKIKVSYLPLPESYY